MWEKEEMREQETERRNTDLRTILSLFGGRLESLEGQSITPLFKRMTRMWLLWETKLAYHTLGW